jgi:DNA-binding NarL/FixJ family response regulator
MESIYPSFKNIWIADDDIDDCTVFERALKIAAPKSDLTIINASEDLMLLLKSQKPDILFLDLNMPSKNGIDCLREMNEREELRSMPIIIYSSSNNQKDINFSYGYGAHLYVRKPSTFDAIVETLTQVLSKDWSTPKQIADEQFINNNYEPFSL